MLCKLLTSCMKWLMHSVTIILFTVHLWLFFFFAIFHDIFVFSPIFRDNGLKAIENLMQKKGKFDYILLETTGLADPGNALMPIMTKWSRGCPQCLTPHPHLLPLRFENCIPLHCNVDIEFDSLFSSTSDIPYSLFNNPCRACGFFWNTEC